MSIETNYDFLLTTLSAQQWKRIGIQRRAGVVVPLFSVYSSQSTGIGDLVDLRLLIDWCKATGMSIIQLLPMNDVGFNFRPYDAQSTFALEPMYLSLDELIGVDSAAVGNEINKIKKDFPTGLSRVNYQIKAAKLKALEKIFKSQSWDNRPAFEAYMTNNAFWLHDYALFKVIKEKNNEMAWEGWGEDLKHKNKEAVASFKKIYHEQILFHQWLQWQLFEQFQQIKKYSQAKNVLLMGDLPFLVSRDSADVWAHQDYFKLGLSAGAPPDMLYSLGQRWGMPPYQWENIAQHNYDYLIEKLKYAQNFYDLYRMDHVVGIFRIWTIPLSEPLEHAGLNGTFDPNDEKQWEDNGRALLSVMIKNSSMLACAEDLGTIPVCTFKVLEELGIPGIDVQRWMRDWGKTFEFKDPAKYRKNAIATVATHDMSCLCAWWEFEAGTVDEELLRRKCKEKNIPFEPIKEKLFDLKNPLEGHHGRLRWKKEIKDSRILLDLLGVLESSAKGFLDIYQGSFDEREKFLKFLGLEQASQETYSLPIMKHVLEKINDSASIFSIQLLQDWLSLDVLFDCDPWELRLNTPGTISDKNWSLVLPLSLEEMLELPVNTVIQSINKQSLRV